MLQEGNPLPEPGAQLNLDPQSEHGTTQRAEPDILAATCCSSKTQEMYKRTPGGIKDL